MESLLAVNEQQVLIPGLKIPRNTTRSVNTSVILDQPILDDNTSVLNPTQKFIAKSKQKIRDCWNWLLHFYIPPKPKVVDEALETYKNQIKGLYNKRDTPFLLKDSRYALKKFAIQYRIDGKDWIDPDLFLDHAKQSITNLLINRRQTKVKLILLCMTEKVHLKSGEVKDKETEFHSKTEVNLVLTLRNCF